MGYCVIRAILNITSYKSVKMKNLIRRIKLYVEGKRIWNDKMSEELHIRILSSPSAECFKPETQAPDTMDNDVCDHETTQANIRD